MRIRSRRNIRALNAAHFKLTCGLTAAEQEGGSSIIAQGRHHQLRDTRVECCLNRLSVGQGLIETDAEVNCGPVSHWLPHADDAQPCSRQRMGQPLCATRVDDYTANALAGCLERPYQSVYRNDVGGTVFISDYDA